MFVCAPRGKIGAQTSASTHFLAKKVSALDRSLPIGDMKGNTSRFSQHCCLQRALLAYRLPAWTRFGEGEAGFQASSPEAEVETRGSSTQARSWHADDVVQTPHVASRLFFYFFVSMPQVICLGKVRFSGTKLLG